MLPRSRGQRERTIPRALCFTRVPLLMPMLAAVLHAQALQNIDLPKIELQKIDNVCSPPDTDAFGLTCSEEDPCPVYLELSSVEGFGANIFVSGNLHTTSVTMFGILLASDDAGKTWTEPVKRVRAATLEQVQFTDPQHGWVAGVTVDPLPRGPFLLSTVNGGQEWHRTPLSDQPALGSIQQFWFDSPFRGQMVVDRSQGKTRQYELYGTTNGGDTWTLKASSGDSIRLPNAKPAEKANWRALPDPSAADNPAYQVERRTLTGWETLARFPIRVGECK